MRDEKLALNEIAYLEEKCQTLDFYCCFCHLNLWSFMCSTNKSRKKKSTGNNNCDDDGDGDRAED